MKLQTKILQTALTSLARLCSRSKGLPILSCVKLEAKADMLTTSFSNLDEYCQERVPCVGGLESVCVNLSALQNAAGGDECDLTLDGNKLVVSWGRNIIKLPIMDPEEFPAMPAMDSTAIGVNCSDLADGVDAVAWCAIKDISRYILQSVHLVGKSKGGLTCEASDGARLALWRMPAVAADFEAIVPASNAKNFTEALRREKAVLGVSEKAVFVSHEGGFYHAKQVDGNYPNTKQVIPGSAKEIGNASVPALSSIVARCCAFPNPRNVGLHMAFGAGGAEFTMATDDDINMTLDGDFKKFKTAMNCKYFLECVHYIPTLTVKLSGVDELSPLVMEAGNLVILQMPVRMV